MDNELTEEMQQNLSVILRSTDLESVTLGLNLLLTFSYPEKFIEIEVEGRHIFFDEYIRLRSQSCINYYMKRITLSLSPLDRWIKDNLRTIYDLEDYGRSRLELID